MQLRNATKITFPSGLPYRPSSAPVGSFISFAFLSDGSNDFVVKGIEFLHGAYSPVELDRLP
jgi:hypothetical protein